MAADEAPHPAFSRFRINAGVEPIAPVMLPVEVEVPPAPVEAPVAEQAKPGDNQGGWFARLKEGLSKTSASLGEGMASLFLGKKAIDDDLLDELETRLLTADVGVEATTAIVQNLTKRVARKELADSDALYKALQQELNDLLKPVEQPLLIDAAHKPYVILVVGVNGAGKTTTIGKLTKHLANEGASVLLAAADTFRAAAREQLGVWADRNLVEIVSQEGGDPAAVSFDAVQAGRARGRDVVIVDTAGRLPTQLHLMEELKKIKRVVQKADASAPHEVLLVIDGNTGQNALAQVKAFDAALQLTGLIVTKLDGTAKGGVLAAIAMWAKEAGREVPVYFIGVGEKLEDLQTFSASEFAQALLS